MGALGCESVNIRPGSEMHGTEGEVHLDQLFEKRHRGVDDRLSWHHILKI
jgi:hypothetical protein